MNDKYELRPMSQDPFDTTRSISTFVTNQRRILDDHWHAPENSRSEAQLVVVKIPPWLFTVHVKRDTTNFWHKAKNIEFFYKCA